MDKVTKDPQKEKVKQFGQKDGSEVHGNQKQILDKVFDFGSDTKSNSSYPQTARIQPYGDY